MASPLGASWRPRATETASGPHSPQHAIILPFGGTGGHVGRLLGTLQSDIEDQFRVRCCNMKTATMLLRFALRPRGIPWYAVWSWSAR
jgi:hypothetical protein